MLIIKTELRESEISGVGVFALEPVTQGQVVSIFVPTLDRIVDVEQFNKHSTSMQEWIKKYGFKDSEGHYRLQLDNKMYTNHSRTPNTKYLDDVTSVATRDVEVGDEITLDYRDWLDEVGSFL